MCVCTIHVYNLSAVQGTCCDDDDDGRDDDVSLSFQGQLVYQRKKFLLIDCTRVFSHSMIREK